MISAVKTQKIINNLKQSFLDQGFSLLLLELLEKFLARIEQDTSSVVKINTDIAAHRDKEKKETDLSQDPTKTQKLDFHPQDSQIITFFLRHEGLQKDRINDEAEIWLRQFVQSMKELHIQTSNPKELSKIEEDNPVPQIKNEGSASEKRMIVQWDKAKNGRISSNKAEKRQQIDGAKIVHQFMRSIEELQDFSEELLTIVQTSNPKELSKIEEDNPVQQVKTDNIEEKRSYASKTEHKTEKHILVKALDLEEVLSDKQETGKEKNLIPAIQKQTHKKLDPYQQNTTSESRKYAEIQIKKIHIKEQVSDQKENSFHITKQDIKTSVKTEQLRSLDPEVIKKEAKSAQEKQIKQDIDLEKNSKTILHNLIKEDPIQPKKPVFRIDTTLTNNDHINKADLVNKLADVIHYTAESNKKEELVVHLKPEFLGRLKIKLTSENGHLRIELFTENHLVKDTIASHVSVLQRILADRGIPVQEIGVFLNWQGFHENRRSTEHKFKSFSKEVSLKEDVVTPFSNKKIWNLEDEEGLEYWA